MNVGDTIDERFEVTGICSTSGGMGNVLFVRDSEDEFDSKLVLKYCKSFDPKLLKRFKREVRLLNDFRGNSKVAQILAFNTDHSPPYYVMEFYADRDLTARQESLRNDPSLQEQTFCDAIDCVAELHAKDVYHRDIKPQNFLQNGDNIVVSDMGLSVEIDSTATTITSTAEAWGTYGYAPPEFRSDGFRNPDAAGDVFMLGKTIYHMLTGRDPVYMTGDGIPPGLFHVIQRACNPDKHTRYQNLAELKQALVSAYDIVLDRVEGINNCRGKLETIASRLENERTYLADEIEDFINSIVALHEGEQEDVCQHIPVAFFRVIAQEPFDSLRSSLLEIYGKMVRNGRYGFSFAEHVADCMKQVFKSDTPSDQEKAVALDLAINSAVSQNRFNAMDTCISLITSITDDSLAEHVRPVLLECKGTFVTSIEPVNCHNDIIGETIHAMSKKEDA